jgi:hypothetical protein
VDEAYGAVEGKFRRHGRSLRTFEMDGGWAALYASSATSHSQTQWVFWAETRVAAAEGAWRAFCEREGLDPAV